MPVKRAFRLGIPATVARDVDDELAFHIEMRTQKLVAQGLSPIDARAEALRQFGDVNAVQQSCVTFDRERDRAMRRADLLGELRQDTWYALRMLRRNIGVTAVVVLSLALGIGANTAIFTLVDAVMLRTLPVPEPDRLVAVGDAGRVNGHSTGSARAEMLSLPLYRDLRDHKELVTGLAASGVTGRLDVRVDSGSGAFEHPSGRFVSGNYFRVLAVPAAQGRMFDDTDDRSVGASPVVVISDRYWTRRFDRGPNVVGRDIVVDAARVTIVGIAPPTFTGEIVEQSPDLWIPIAMQPVMQPKRALMESRRTSWLLTIGRLAPGVTLAQADAGFTAILRQSMAANPTEPGNGEAYRTAKTFISSGAKGLSSVRRTYSAPLLTLTVGVGLLMLIICANVANLLFARAVARSREMSVRLAIGAGRARLIRQLLTESVVVAVLSAAMGLALAVWGSHLLLALATDGGAAIPLDVRLDLPVLGFTLGLTVLAVAIFGLAPALGATRQDVATAMRAHARSLTGGALGARGRRVPIGKLLVAGQVGLSVVLLVGAALLVRSLQSVQFADAGLDRDHLLIVTVDATDRGYYGERRAALTRDLSEAMSREPGVVSVTFSQNGIFSGTDWRTSVKIPGFTAKSPDDSLIYADEVGPGYVQGIGARLLQGRDISARDVAHTPSVAVVNEALAHFYFGRESAIGKVFRIDDSTETSIVGVIADVKDHTLTRPPERRAYLPYLQSLVGNDQPDKLTFEVRTPRDPAQAVPDVRRAIAAVDALLPISEIAPLARSMRESIREERLLTRLAAGFGILALLLAALGLYGVMTYAISRRTGEIGLRMALGAQRGDVIGLVLREALTTVVVGIVVGVPLALASTRLLRNQLHGVDAADPLAIGVALAVLAASAVVAALLPALRAARVTPLEALRED